MLSDAEQERWTRDVYYPGIEARAFEETLAGLRTIVNREGRDVDRRIARMQFTNPHADVLKFLTDGYATTRAQNPNVAGVYVELNGFSINTDVWFAELRGTEYVEKSEVPTWEPGETWEYWKGWLDMTGGEDAQKAYATVVPGERSTYTMLLTAYIVHAEFMKLFREAWDQGPAEDLRFTALITAHDFWPVTYLEPRTG